MRINKQWVMTTTSFLMIVFIYLSCGSNSRVEDSEVVATVGDYRVTAGQLRQNLMAEFKDKSLSEVSESEKSESLEKLLESRRKAIWATGQGMNQDTAFIAAREKFSDRVLATTLYQQKVIDALIPKEMLEKYYDWYFEDVKAVIVKVGFENATIKDSRTEDEALQLAKRYAEEMEISQDPELAAKTLTEGNKKAVMFDPYRIGNLPIKGDSLVFNTPAGDVGGPVKLSEGWVLIRVLERNKREKDRSFKAVSEELTRIFRGQKRNQELALFDKLSRQYRDAHNAVTNDEGINQFVNVIREWGKAPRPDVSAFSQADRSIVLGEVQGEKITSGQFLNMYGDMLIRDFQSVGNFSTIKDRFVLQELNLRCWMQEAKATGVQNTPEYQEEMERFTINQLVRMVDDREVNQKIDDASDAEIEAYYNENPEKYTTLAQMDVRQIVVSAEALAEQVADRARQGEDFEALYEEFVGDRKMPVTQRYDLGTLTPNHRMKEVVEAVFAAGGNQVVGPVKYNNAYHVLKTGTLQPAKQKSLESVKSSVRAAVINEKRNQRREQLNQEIRRKISVDIDESVLRAVS